VTEPRTLHTVGDSHALYAWPMLDLPGWEVRCHHLGARLMHTFAEEAEELVDLNGLGLRPGDGVVFSFGEIDCRVHAHEHGVEGLGRRYVERVASLRNGLPPGPWLILAVVPPEREPHGRSAGNPAERLGYVRFLNHEMRLLCPEFGLGYLDAYQAYADADGFFAEELKGHRGHMGDHLPLQTIVREALGLMVEEA
jgi:hypothetical protein